MLWASRKFLATLALLVVPETLTTGNQRFDMVMKNLTITTAVTATLVTAAPAGAADLYEPMRSGAPLVEDNGHGFEWSIIPFNGWIPGMSGTVGAFNVTTTVDITPIEILQNLDTFLDVLDGAYIGSGQVRYNRFGLLYDVFYLDVSSTIDIGHVGVDVSFSQFMGTIAPTYRVLESPKGYLDALAGIRYYDISNEVGVFSDGGSWTDPIVGVSGRYNLSDRVYVSGWGMIGGFGAGSEFTWDLWGNVGYQWHDWLDIYAGFRGTGADYHSGGFTWDVIQYGPTVGAVLRF
jgi:hypothetical protein